MLKRQSLTPEELQKISFEKFKKSSISKMRTIMIGAVADLERMCEGAEFDEVRKSILDRGNNLIRAFELELEQYEIHYKGQITIFRRENED